MLVWKNTRKGVNGREGRLIRSRGDWSHICYQEVSAYCGLSCDIQVLVIYHLHALWSKPVERFMGVACLRCREGELQVWVLPSCLILCYRLKSMCCADKCRNSRLLWTQHILWIHPTNRVFENEWKKKNKNRDRIEGLGGSLQPTFRVKMTVVDYDVSCLI